MIRAATCLGLGLLLALSLSACGRKGDPLTPGSPASQAKVEAAVDAAERDIKTNPFE